MIRASLMELKAKYSRMKMSTRAMGTAIVSLARAVRRFSNCPPYSMVYPVGNLTSRLILSLTSFTTDSRSLLRTFTPTTILRFVLSLEIFAGPFCIAIVANSSMAKWPLGSWTLAVSICWISWWWAASYRITRSNCFSPSTGFLQAP